MYIEVKMIVLEEGQCVRDKSGRCCTEEGDVLKCEKEKADARNSGRQDWEMLTKLTWWNQHIASCLMGIVASLMFSSAR